MPTTIESYVPFGVFALIVAGLGCVMLASSSLLGPKRSAGEIKNAPWECGVPMLQSSARERFAVPFYLVAILFIIFDLETVFLFPWAVVVKRIAAQDAAASLTLLVEIAAFVGVLGIGLFYVWKRRGLEWD